MTKTHLLLTTINSGFRILIGFLCLKLLAIFGQPDDVLQFGQIQSYLNIFTTLAQLGLGYGILTAFRETQSNKERFLLEMMSLFTISGILLFAINFLYPNFVSSSVRSITTSIWFFIALMGSIYIALIHSYFVTSQKPSQANLLQIISYVTALVLISIMIFYNIQLLGLAIGIANILVSMVALVMLKGKLSIFYPSIKKQFTNVVSKNIKFIIFTLTSVIVAQGTLIVSRDVFFNSPDSEDGAILQIIFSMMFAVSTIYTTYMTTYYFASITTAAKTFDVIKKISVATLAIFTLILLTLNLVGDQIIEIFLSNQYIYKTELNFLIIADLLKNLALPIVFFLVAKRYLLSLILAELLAFLGFIVTLNFVPSENRLLVVGLSFNIGALLSFMILSITLFVILRVDKQI